MREHRYRHLEDAATFGITEIRRAFASVGGFNAKTAVVVTGVLGSMPFFWFANLLALVSLPAVLTLVDPALKTFFPAALIKVSLISLVSWIAQTYIQLVALPVLQVSNNAQGRQQEHDTKIILADGEATREHTETILDLLDTRTEGGLKAILDALESRQAP